MKVASLYHAVLKDLKQVSVTRPHYLNDLRFVLSRPLVASPSIKATASGATSGATSSTASSLASPSCSPAATVTEESLTSYLRRPSCQMIPIDSEKVFQVCKADLRHFLDAKPKSDGSQGASPVTAAVLNPIADQLLRLRELKWIHDRLTAILNDNTLTLLQQHIHISSELTSEDFIPSNAFDDSVDEAEAPPSSSGEPSVAEGALLSAAAVGCQREVFCYRVKNHFPILTAYLESSQELDDAVLKSKENHHADLVTYVQNNLPKFTVARNEDMKLHVSVSPFDKDYTAQSDVGYFGNAHRIFNVDFTIETSDKDGIEIVNSYFTRLDISLKELTEDVGYIPVSEVVRMQRAMDYKRIVVGELLEEDKTTSTSTTGGKHSTPATTTTQKGSKVVKYSMTFDKSSDGPTSLKGVLYYKVGTAAAAANANRSKPIKMISFEQVLLHMEESTSIAAFYPTSSSSLQQHAFVRVIWLPLANCLKMAGSSDSTLRSQTSPARAVASGGRSLNSSFSRSATQLLGSHLTADLNDETVSGYELRLKQACLQHATTALKDLRGAFPDGSCSYYTPDGQLRFHIGHDTSTSQWENMDSFRCIHGVIVVVNTHDESMNLPETIQIVHTLFQSQYKDKVCRCYLLDPKEEVVKSLPSSTHFVAIRTSQTLDATARSIMSELGTSIVLTINRMLSILESQKQTDTVILRTPADKADLSDLKAAQLTSRLHKKKGDIYLQLGAYDAALAAYGKTQFASNVDPLWCHATMESIAAARFQQLQYVLERLASVNKTIVELQSEATEWKEHLTLKVDQLESVLMRLGKGVKNTLALCKSASLPNSMRAKLQKDVDDVLTAKTTQLTSLLQRVRACISAGTLELASDPQAFRIPEELKHCTEEILKTGLGEIEVYLRESLRQQRHTLDRVVVSKTSLRDRDLETRLKALTYLVDRGEALIFLDELSMNRDRFSEAYKGTMSRVLPYFVVLCIRCGYRRRAVSLLIEHAHLDRASKNYKRSIQSLTMASVLCGVDLNFSELRWEIRSHPLYPLLFPKEKGAVSAVASPTARVGVTNSSVTDGSFSMYGEELHPDQGSSKRKEHALTSQTKFMHISLLMELLDVLEECGSSGSSSIRCRLATFLLFRYANYLDYTVQDMLINIARVEALKLEPHISPSIADVPFCAAWEALPLPLHLAPKTVSVGGAFFTFIDKQRLKFTVLSLNGKKLNSRVVWTVGDVGSVLMTLYNPFEFTLRLLSLALQCRTCSDLDDHNNIPEGAETHITGPSAPTCYVLTNVSIPPHTKTRVQLQVQPKKEGYLRVEGVELRTAHFQSLLPIEGKLPEPMGIPVLQRLPLVSCTVSESELEIFGGQRVDFSVRVVNCGQVPIAHISLTAHSEACQLEDCEGCKERASKKDATVSLNKAALQAATRAPLQPGDVVNIPVHLQAPMTIDDPETHFVIFRIDCSLPHDPPTMPLNVPSAVPVYGVIPRRVTETRMRTFHAPSLSVTSIQLTKDKRFVDVRITNRSDRHSVALHLSTLPFADLPDALIVAGAAYVVPPIAITQVPDNCGYIYRVPWVIREMGNCTGELVIDFGLIGREVVCSEPLDECVVTVDVEVPPTQSRPFLSLRHWNSHPDTLHKSRVSNSKLVPSCADLQRSGEMIPMDFVDNMSLSGERDMVDNNNNQGPNGTPQLMVLPAVRPVQLHVHATARWKRAIPLRFQVSMDYHLDVGILSGQVDSTTLVGEHGSFSYSQSFELLAFKTGEHAITITITDNCDREITHHMPFCIQHSIGGE